MPVPRGIRWQEEADVIVVGYGGAGAVAAITAHDAGAKVLIVEKQANDCPNETRHTPSTRMSGGAWFSASDAESAYRYLKALVRVSNEELDRGRARVLRTFATYLTENTDWMKSMGAVIGTRETLDLDKLVHGVTGNDVVMQGNKLLYADFPGLPGTDSAGMSFVQVSGQFRNGAALFKVLSEAVQRRGIPVMWESPACHLLTDRGEICGLLVATGRRKVAIRARRAVVLTCGGFEHNRRLKETFLRVNPVHFYGNPGNTGDGITMAMEVGASLWHMSSASWRVSMKFPEHPISFCTQHHSGSIFIDRLGNRFTNERYNLHAFGYELTNYDCYAMCYPKVPFYWLFSEKRRKLAPLASLHGPCSPPGGVMGKINYVWSSDNQEEIDRGWIIAANTAEELASKIRRDPDNGGLMSSAILKATIERYNELCEKGKDLDFGKGSEHLDPIEGPLYAVKLWPGGPNTQGGPKRNERGQILSVNGTVIPRLYSAGELGSVWGMLYQGGGNIAECIAFGRIAGANAAAENLRN